MTKDDKTQVSLEQLAQSFNEREINLIDFDDLRERLLMTHRQLQIQEEMRQELALIRDDYQQRIAGMVKAIAAVDRKHDSPKESLAWLEQLPAMSVENLIKAYRKISACFRDAFPASFGLLKDTGISKVKTVDYQNFK